MLQLCVRLFHVSTAQAKVTKKITLRMECKDCKYKLQLALKRCKVRVERRKWGTGEVVCCRLSACCLLCAACAPRAPCSSPLPFARSRPPQHFEIGAPSKHVKK